MSKQPSTPHPVAKAVEELHAVLGQLSGSKGKSQKGITSTMKEHWSGLVATIFSDRDCPVDTLLQELQRLPPSVVASGIASAWERMDEIRRNSYLTWVASLDSAKAASHKVVLIPSLLDRFPSVSLELFCGLSLNQELKSRLATALLGKMPERVASMISQDLPEWKARQALERLCQITEGPKVDMKGKWEVIRLTLRTLVERKLQEDSFSQRLLQHVEGQLPNLAPQFHEQLRGLLADLDPSLLGRFLPSFATESGGPVPELVETTAPAVPAPMPERLAESEPLSAAVSSAEPNILDRLAIWIDRVHEQAALLNDTRARILQLEGENKTVRTQVDATRAAEAATRGAAEEAYSNVQQAQQKIQTLEADYRENQQALNRSLARSRELQSALDEAHQREAHLRATLQDREKGFGKEREDLQRLIEANADRRLQEFQNGVAGSLRKLLSKIPGRGTPVSPALAAVLLIRLHEVIDELDQKGIHTRPEHEDTPK
jgi:hypothetical protein